MFTSSQAYLPPKWAGGPSSIVTPSEAKESVQSVRMEETSQFGQRKWDVQQQTKIIRFNQKEVERSSEQVRETGTKVRKEIPVFMPKKFVPGKSCQSRDWKLEASDAKIKAKWAPSDSGKLILF